MEHLRDELIAILKAKHDAAFPASPTWSHVLAVARVCFLEFMDTRISIDETLYLCVVTCTRGGTVVGHCKNSSRAYAEARALLDALK